MIKPEDITAVIDTREQQPYDLSPMKVVRAGLKTGDYSLLGFEDEICIERKSFEDYLGCIGGSRERWERELVRMDGYRTKAVVLEASWRDLRAGRFRSRVHPNSIVGSTLGWILNGIPVVLVGDRDEGQAAVKNMLWIMAKRRERQNAGIHDHGKRSDNISA